MSGNRSRGTRMIAAVLMGVLPLLMVATPSGADDNGQWTQTPGAGGAGLVTGQQGGDGQGGNDNGQGGDNSGRWTLTPASVRAVRGANSRRGGNGVGRWSPNPKKPRASTTTSSTRPTTTTTTT